MICRLKIPPPPLAALLLPGVFLLAGLTLLPTVRAQTLPGVSPTPAPEPLPSPGLGLGSGDGSTPAPLDPSAPILPPQINALPPGTPPVVQRPSLPPATVSELDSEYNSAISVQIPTIRFAGRGLSLLEAVRLTVSHNPQVQLSAQDTKLARAFLQQATSVFDSRVLINASRAHNDDERTPAALRADAVNRMRKALLARQFLASAARLQADLNNSVATGQPPQQDFTNGTSSIGNQNGALTNAQVVVLDQQSQALANQQKQTNDQLNALLLQIAQQNATPDQIAQLQALQASNVNQQQQQEQQFITAFGQVGAGLARDVANLPHVTQDSNSFNYSVGLTKLFRDGASIQPLASFSQSGSGSGLPNNRARVGVTLNVPLLRNAGEEATGAAERAAGIDYEASQLAYRHTISLSVFQTTQLYWNVVAAQRRVELLRQSQRVASTLLGLSRQLVKADELAPADVFVIAARVNDTAIQVDQAEIALLDLQQQLAVQIGEDPAKLTVPLVAVDRFLPSSSSESLRRLAREPLVRTAEDRRADLQATRKLQVSGKVLARAAQLNLKPRLDFSINASFSAIDDGSHANKNFHAFTTSYTGPSVFGSVVFDWPVANNLQRSLLSQARATLAQRVIRTTDLQRIIDSSVVFSLGSVENALLQLEQSLAASSNYRQSLDAEYAKLKAGNSTFLNAVEVEERYTLAGLNIISAQLQYATSLARVRFETGTIMPPTPDATIGWDELTTIPTPVAPPVRPPPERVLLRRGGGPPVPGK